MVEVTREVVNKRDLEDDQGGNENNRHSGTKRIMSCINICKMYHCLAADCIRQIRQMCHLWKNSSPIPLLGLVQTSSLAEIVLTYDLQLVPAKLKSANLQK